MQKTKKKQKQKKLYMFKIMQKYAKKKSTCTLYVFLSEVYKKTCLVAHNAQRWIYILLTLFFFCFICYVRLINAVYSSLIVVSNLLLFELHLYFSKYVIIDNNIIILIVITNHVNGE